VLLSGGKSWFNFPPGVLSGGKSWFNFPPGYFPEEKVGLTFRRVTFRRYKSLELSERLLFPDSRSPFGAARFIGGEINAADFVR
jgi:hypothetical protein